MTANNHSVRIWPFPLLSCISDIVAELLVEEKMVLFRCIRDFYAAVQQQESGLLFYHYFLTHILNGSATVSPPRIVSAVKVIVFGQYLHWDMRVRMSESQYSIADRILSRWPIYRERAAARE